MSDAEFVQIPDDPLKRIFKLRTIGLDMRVQIVIISHDEPSARSIAAQFQAFVDQGDKRRFKAVYEFAQTETLWPCQIENTSVPFLNIPSEAENLTLLASDLTLHCTVPLFEASPVGKGITPYGFPAVREVRYDGFTNASMCATPSLGRNWYRETDTSNHRRILGKAGHTLFRLRQQERRVSDCRRF